MQQQTYYEYPACRHQVISYPLQVWLFSLLSTPLLAVAWSIAGGNWQEDHSLSLMGHYFNILFSQVIFTIPSIIVYALVFWLLGGLGLRPMQTKILLALSGLACFYAIFFLFPNNMIARQVDEFLFLFTPVFVTLSMVLKLRKN